SHTPTPWRHAGTKWTLHGTAAVVVQRNLRTARLQVRPRACRIQKRPRLGSYPNKHSGSTESIMSVGRWLSTARMEYSYDVGRRCRRREDHTSCLFRSPDIEAASTY